MILVIYFKKNIINIEKMSGKILVARGFADKAAIAAIAASLCRNVNDGVRVGARLLEAGEEIIANGPYIEGPVRQSTGIHPQQGVNTASFLMKMDHTAEPRPEFCPPNHLAGEIRDSGVHFHFGGRFLNAYIPKGALLLVPTFDKMIVDSLEENRDYRLHSKEFELLNGTTREGGITVFGPEQHLIFTFGTGVSHSFDGYGEGVSIQSVHIDEAGERNILAEQTSGNGASFTDATQYLVAPALMTDAWIKTLAETLDFFQQQR